MERIEHQDRIPQFGQLQMDISSRTIRFLESNESERLSPDEYQVLWLLVRAKGGIVPGSQMENFIYADLPDDKDLPLSSGVHTFIYRIRSKLEKLTKGKITIEREGTGKGSRGYFLQQN